jgi:Rhodopirellula transposase DDE domain
MSSWRWTHKTTIKIAGQLQRLGIQVGPRTVSRLLGKLRFSLRGNRKNISSGSRSGRDQQFGRIARLRKHFCRQGDPIISVDAKKRELVGNFKNAGVKWERVSTQVNDHDFRSLSSGIALPYGIYDLQANRGSVFVGVSHETSAFAVHSICRWWKGEGRQRYPNSQQLLILADTGAAIPPHVAPGRTKSSSTSRMSSDLPSPLPTIPPAPPSTTPSSAACSVRSARTGPLSLSPATTRPSSSSAKPPQPRGSRFERIWTGRTTRSRSSPRPKDCANSGSLAPNSFRSGTTR